MQCCSLQHQKCFHRQAYPQLSVISGLAPLFILSRALSPLFPSSISAVSNNNYNNNHSNQTAVGLDTRLVHFRTFSHLIQEVLQLSISDLDTVGCLPQCEMVLKCWVPGKEETGMNSKERLLEAGRSNTSRCRGDFASPARIVPLSRLPVKPRIQG